MLKNIVFDIGQVLLTFEPERYLQNYFDSQEEIERVARATFRSPEWLNLDRGTWNRQQAVDYFAERLPEIAEPVKEAVLSWPDMLKPISGTIEILTELSAEDYNIYALSNYPAEGYEEAREIFSFWKHFDGLVISGQEGYIKPESEIYHILLARYELEPGETLFIDDSPQNIEGAHKAGMQGIVFTGAAELREMLLKKEVL